MKYNLSAVKQRKGEELNLFHNTNGDGLLKQRETINISFVDKKEISKVCDSKKEDKLHFKKQDC